MMRLLRRGADQGSMAVYVVVLTPFLLMMAGLVVDGGGALVARQRAADEAGQAARTGANQLDLAQLRDNDVRVIDVGLAKSAVDNYFTLAGNSPTHSTDATPNKVTVSVTVTYAPKVIPWINKSYTASATALPISK
ncbi:MAG: TadE family protein [Pseudonocardiales bacterium]|nr:MAG: TadE family protein [Pseudonocardiales bacterium]